jgi:luciferase family oxidoreductase group 1
MVPFSLLDLSPVCEGSNAAQSFRNTVDLARHAEAWGYRRFWLAEHHNMPGIASAATAVLIGHVAGNTTAIRVGAGGIMLPNHSPLAIAEQFGTLESLFPGRIDLGLGRAPGGDQATARALRSDFHEAAEEFPRNVLALQSYFAPAKAGQAVQAVPGAGLDVPLWILGSSLFGAQLAARLGLPFAFASHFAPDLLDQALIAYRREFRPSAALPEPYAMMGVNAIAAASDAEAERLFTSQQLQFVNSRRGRRGRLGPPVERLDEHCNEVERALVERTLACSAVGAPETVRNRLDVLIRTHDPDEVIVTGHIFDHASRLGSFDIVSGIMGERAKAPIVRVR